MRFLKSHELDNYNITLYTFRHSFATFLLEERENPKIVAKLIGHAKASTTLNLYSHVVNNNVYEETARTLDGVFAKYMAVSDTSLSGDATQPDPEPTPILRLLERSESAVV